MHLPIVAAVVLAAVAGSADPGRHLEGRQGTLVVFDSRTGSTLRVDPERAARRFPPCSTFKVPNSLISLQAGVVREGDWTLRWDPARDPQQDWWPRRWAGDHDLPSAMRHSVVWYYQELARRVGAGRMAREVARIGYGNADTSGGVDTFWLGSSLAISADEQIAFLRRFHAGDLGFDDAVTGIVKEAIVLERGDGWSWSGKTGTCPLEGGGYLGWLVGYAERGGDVAFYALNLHGATTGELWGDRMRIVRAVLADLGYLPSPAR